MQQAYKIPAFENNKKISCYLVMSMPKTRDIISRLKIQ